MEHKERESEREREEKEKNSLESTILHFIQLLLFDKSFE